MTFQKSFIAFLAAGMLLSCQNEEVPEVIVKEKVEGFVQKGPYINGTSIIVSELNGKLVPTGRNFNTQITDNSGNFQINKVSLSSRYVMLKADGYYFNEVSGIPSAAPLTLYALSDLGDKSSINVNLLSYLEKARIEYLIGEGISFDEAKRQALQEILAVFNIQVDSAPLSETLDISKAGDDNAILLALSVILQGQRSVAELSELLANFSTDMRQDGVLNSQSLGSKLINDVKYMDLSTVRTNIQNRYADMGIAATIPDFEKWVQHFIANTTFEYNKRFTYPGTGLYGTNFLNLVNNASLSSGTKYSFAAHVPAGSNLKIVVKGISGLWYTGTNVQGWQVGSYDSQTNSQTFTALETGKNIDLELALSYTGSCTLEFYENNSPTPGTIKTISWEQPATADRYPETGGYGVNLLSLSNGSAIAAQQYSIALNLPTSDEYTTEIKMTFSGTGTYIIDDAKVQNWQYTQSGNELILKCSGKAITADMPITLSGEGTVSIQSTELNSSLSWK